MYSYIGMNIIRLIHKYTKGIGSFTTWNDKRKFDVSREDPSSRMVEFSFIVTGSERAYVYISCIMIHTYLFNSLRDWINFLHLKKELKKK